MTERAPGAVGGGTGGDGGDGDDGENAPRTPDPGEPGSAENDSGDASDIDAIPAADGFHERDGLPQRDGTTARPGRPVGPGDAVGLAGTVRPGNKGDVGGAGQEAGETAQRGAGQEAGETAEEGAEEGAEQEAGRKDGPVTGSGDDAAGGTDTAPATPDAKASSATPDAKTPSAAPDTDTPPAVSAEDAPPSTSASAEDAPPSTSASAEDAPPSPHDADAGQDSGPDTGRDIDLHAASDPDTVPDGNDTTPGPEATTAAEGVPVAARSADEVSTAAGRTARGGGHTGRAEKAERPRKRHTWLRWVAGGVGVAVLATAAAGWWFYQKLDNNISTDTKAAAELQTYAKERPTPVALDALNILLIGSDSRSGKGNEKYGHNEDGTARSDTTILLHLAADRKSATAVSIPRDLMVQIPSCGESGHTTPAQFAQFNWAFQFGGTACTTRTVEQLTGVRIDHEMVIDFSGFKDMVNAVGGVQVCLAAPVDDQQAHLKLPAGKQTVNGEQALGFVRARHGFGDGSDTERIQRQQGFLGSLFSKLQSNGVLLNPTRLYPVLDAATKAITTDPGLDSLRDLYNLAHSMRDVPADKVQFITVPRQPYEPDPNRDELVQPEADSLFRQLRDDAPVTVKTKGSAQDPGAETGDRGAPSGSPTGSPGSPSGPPSGAPATPSGEDSGTSGTDSDLVTSPTPPGTGSPPASDGTAAATPGPTFTGTNASVGPCE